MPKVFGTAFEHFKYLKEVFKYKYFDLINVKYKY